MPQSKVISSQGLRQQATALTLTFVWGAGGRPKDIILNTPLPEWLSSQAIRIAINVLTQLEKDLVWEEKEDLR